MHAASESPPLLLLFLSCAEVVKYLISLSASSSQPNFPGATMTFKLHTKLQKDTTGVSDLALCRVLLMEDARYPWLILVPAIPDLRELHDLETEQADHLFKEISLTSKSHESLTGAFKINVAALGNQVPQLHIHVIARQQDDATWPNPVWGVGKAKPYQEDKRMGFITDLRRLLISGV